MTIDSIGSKSALTFMPLPQDVPKRRRPHITLAEEHLDWRPRVALADGLSQTITSFDRLMSNSAPAKMAGRKT